MSRFVGRREGGIGMSRLFSWVGRFFRHTDKLSLSTAIAVSSLSVALLMGINAAGYCGERVVQVQIIAAGLGIVAACVVGSLDYDMLARFWKFYAPLVALVNLYTAFFGDTRPGTTNRSWLDPVSYTHLDVYKRQDSRWWGCTPRKSSRGSADTPQRYGTVLQSNKP